MFSADPTEAFHASQKVTYGSFDTVSAVTTLNTGVLPQTGARVLASFDERHSNGELSYSGGEAENQLVKIAFPMGPSGS